MRPTAANTVALTSGVYGPAVVYRSRTANLLERDPLPYPSPQAARGRAIGPLGENPVKVIHHGDGRDPGSHQVRVPQTGAATPDDQQEGDQQGDQAQLHQVDRDFPVMGDDPGGDPVELLASLRQPDVGG